MAVAGAGQSMFAALAFTGSGYLFKMFDKSGYSAEIQRHNEAMEHLAKAKEAFYENEVKYHDKIQELRGKIEDANKDIKSTNDALDLLQKVRTIKYDGRNFNRPPVLGDFYKPSNEMKDFQWVFIGVLGGLGGYIIYRMS